MSAVKAIKKSVELVWTQFIELIILWSEYQKKHIIVVCHSIEKTKQKISKGIRDVRQTLFFTAFHARAQNTVFVGDHDFYLYFATNAQNVWEQNSIFFAFCRKCPKRLGTEFYFFQGNTISCHFNYQEFFKTISRTQ